jgi:hypothetical protein
MGFSGNGVGAWDLIHLAQDRNSCELL